MPGSTSKALCAAMVTRIDRALYDRGPITWRLKRAERLPEPGSEGNLPGADTPRRSCPGIPERGEPAPRGFGSSVLHSIA